MGGSGKHRRASIWRTLLDGIDVGTLPWAEKLYRECQGGHPHSDALQVIERFLRRDFRHMELQVTIDDPKTYRKPRTVAIPYEYVADTELLDWVCDNNKDPEHLVGK